MAKSKKMKVLRQITTYNKKHREGKRKKVKKNPDKLALKGDDVK